MTAPTRDRLARPVDISTLYRGAARRVNLIVDEPGLSWMGLSRAPTRGSRGRSVRRPGIGGWENRVPGRRGGYRGRGSVLPSWYPRTPLRDITSIVRAIERRRARLHAHHDQALEAPHEENNAQPEPSSSNLEHETEVATPKPTMAIMSDASAETQLGKIMSDVPDKTGSDSDFITPQKKLLDSIDNVREVWLEEQRKVESTPAAKKEERKRKVRTLMSMR